MSIHLGKICNKLSSGDTARHVSNYFCKPSVGWIYDTSRIVVDSVSYGGKHYKTVAIGAQVWFAENLDYADSVSNPNLKGASWCAGSNDGCSQYGRVYTWAAAMNQSAAGRRH